MADQKRNNQSISEKALEALGADPVDEIAEELRQEREERLKERTPSGRRSKQAKLAGKEAELESVIKGALASLNRLFEAKAPELVHTDDEIETYAVYGSRVLAKYVDLALVKYGPEFVLLTYAASTEIPKVAALVERKKLEKKAKGGKKRDAMDHGVPGSDGSGKDLSGEEVPA